MITFGGFRFAVGVSCLLIGASAHANPVGQSAASLLSDRLEMTSSAPNPMMPVEKAEPEDSFKSYFVAFGLTMSMANPAPFFTALGLTDSSMTSLGINLDLGYRLSRDFSASFGFSNFGYSSVVQTVKVVDVGGIMFSLAGDYRILGSEDLALTLGGGGGFALAKAENAVPTITTVSMETSKIPSFAFFGRVGFEYLFKFAAAGKKSNFSRFRNKSSTTYLGVRVHAGYRLQNVSEVRLITGGTADLSLNGLFFAASFAVYF